MSNGDIDLDLTALPKPARCFTNVINAGSEHISTVAEFSGRAAEQSPFALPEQS